eukprot:CAMPEP_0196593140 /NCGR_PEP_ID=MMETSP1081-20130531/74790_1 /TAXON_ID=36882 /ORGANISM="Pyramimonas amylifera, Strain CCMP720" /LENGTH=139 /DNA_ID=CAMNT_0041917027 /DNA_START=114 /DNA_END=533 /DNA_ORIENTATION=-
MLATQDPILDSLYQVLDTLAKIGQRRKRRGVLLSDENKTHLNPMHSKSADKKQSAPLNSAVDAILDGQRTIQLLASMVTDLLAKMPGNIYEPRVFQLAPNWHKVYDAYKIEMEAISAMCAFYDVTVNFILKEQKQEHKQ